MHVPVWLKKELVENKNWSKIRTGRKLELVENKNWSTLESLCQM